MKQPSKIPDMKKLLTTLMLLLTGATAAVAQNANRSGVFVEAGVGLFTGQTPRTSVGRTMDDQFVYTVAKGCAIDLSAGYRLRFANHWAYEWRAGLEASPAHFNPFFNPKFFPIGFRYTSTELFRNSSLYAHANLGISFCPFGDPDDFGYVEGEDRWIDKMYNPLRPGETKCLEANWNYQCGIVYSLGIGLNITNHLYAGLTYDAQVNISRYYNAYYPGIFHHSGHKSIYWGTIGLRIGYRF